MRICRGFVVAPHKLPSVPYVENKDDVKLCFIYNLTVWGVKSFVAYQSGLKSTDAYQSQLQSTDVSGVQPNQATETNHHDPLELSFMCNEKVWHENAMLPRCLASEVSASDRALSTACC